MTFEKRQHVGNGKTPSDNVTLIPTTELRKGDMTQSPDPMSLNTAVAPPAYDLMDRRGKPCGAGDPATVATPESQETLKEGSEGEWAENGCREILGEVLILGVDGALLSRNQ